MIFGTNTTSLNTKDIPMAEGYDCSYGGALALVESAQNDMAMFKAMMNTEFTEARIRRESNGVVMEGNLQVLTEATLSGIWAKIKELFSKLMSKLKAIFTTFMSKINGLWMKDKELVKKYRELIRSKGNIGNLQVKWKTVTLDKEIGAAATKATGLTLDGIAKEIANAAGDDKNYTKIAISKVWTKDSCETVADMKKSMMDTGVSSEETKKISELGGAGAIMDELSKTNDMVGTARKEIFDGPMKTINRALKDIERESSAANKATGEGSDDKAKVAREIYEAAKAMHDVILGVQVVYLDMVKIKYKYHKSAFMKMVAANNDKLKESTMLLDAIAEMSADEVEDVIEDSITKIDVNDSCEATDELLGAGVSDNPDANTFASMNKIDADYEPAGVDGSVQSTIDGRVESAFFSEPLY